MQQKQYEVIMGGLLHDVGKILYRYGDGRNHAESGYEFLREEAKLEDEEILGQVHYHHAAGLKNADLPADSLAYITYIADNIAAAADRRKSDIQGKGFVRELAQDSIFNLLNGNDGHAKYPPNFLIDEINYPVNGEVKYDTRFYDECLRNIRDCVKGISFQSSYLNSLLEVLEATLTYIPSSTSQQEVADVSLFDHCKLTAAFGSCILAYTEQANIQNLREELLEKAHEFYEKKVFLLYSMDISGIQDFIYTISSDKALKALRSRSFYLELLMEHLVDEILSDVCLSRANCIYCGGGHAYLLFPNTSEAKERIRTFEDNVNAWFLETFGTALYVAGGFAPCSANDLKNEPGGSYQALFTTVSSEISKRKLNRYTASQIAALNTMRQSSELRECSVCRRTDHLGDGEKCSICEGLEKFSGEIQNQAFFAITETQDQHKILPLPRDTFVTAEKEETLFKRMQNDRRYKRCYCKNEFYTGKELAAKIWVGDYQNGDSFQALARSSGGIRRLAVLRADVDNLGQTFVSGFESEKHGQKYVTLSRTATFSRKLSIFFKRHVNVLLKNSVYSLTVEKPGPRNATIVYSGGDDMFVIGAWDDIIGFAVDLHSALEKYSQKTLTISAGIGIYPEKYPVSSMAREVGMLEETAKGHPGKNAVTLFSEEHTYSWDVFIHSVLEEKYAMIRAFFQSMPEYGKSFLYNLLDYMRNREEQINIARYAYLLARMEPKDDASEEERALYQQFSMCMYQWIRDEEQCQQAITAIYIYIYTIRDSEGGA